MTLVVDPDVMAETKAWWEEINGSLGVSYLDAQHLYLVSLIMCLKKISRLESLEELISQFRKVFVELISYAEQHFKAEEAAFEALGYPSAEQHKRQHASFVVALHKLSHSSITRETVKKLYRYLRQWLTIHILKEDRHYAQYFARRKVNLNEFYQRYVATKTQELGEVEKELYREILGEQYHLVAEDQLVLQKTAEVWKFFNLRIGVPLIDIQHLWLVKITVELENALHKSKDERKEIFSFYWPELLRYAKEHFAAEELLMSEVGYPDIQQHQASHATFLASLQDRKVTFHVENELFLINLVRDLKEWLCSHIALADRLMASYLLKEPQKVAAISRELLQNKRVTFVAAQLALYNAIVKRK